jgi:hypothetical protein
MSLRLSVMMYYLKEIVFRILEYHEDTFVLEDDFFQLDDVGMRELSAQGHLSDG